MTKDSSYPNFFKFLVEKEKSRECFSAQDVALALNIKKETAQKYINEKLKSYLFTEKKLGKNVYYSKSISVMGNEEFIKIMSQGYKVKELTNIEVFYNKLIEKSFDAFTIALETYNRPTLKNKVEVFVILIVNAWEILLKAKIIKDNQTLDKIYKEGQTNQSGDKYTISIYEALGLIYGKENIIYKNLIEVIYLRDRATHLLIDDLRAELSPLFQASIINYIEEYEVSFGKIPLINESTGMLTLVIPGDIDIFEVKKIYGDKTYKEIEDFLEKLNFTKNELNSNNFMCEVNYSVYLEKKNKDKANINVNIVDDDSNAKNVKIIKQKVNFEDTHPLKFSEVVKKIKEKYSKFNNNTMTAFVKKHSIKSDENYYHRYETIQRYSYKLINFINKEIENDHNFFENIMLKVAENNKKSK